MALTNNIVLDEANKLGFDLVGFTKAVLLSVETDRLQEWINNGYNASMSYLERNIDKRNDVNLLLPGAKSVISLGSNYFIDEDFSGDKNIGKISRYAWGRDYHNILWEKLNRLIARLKQIDPLFEAISFVDSGPVMDKVWAKKAGLGWFGKHSNIINKNIGSWFFISSIITNYDFIYSIPVPDFCGSCTACIDACPTGAIEKEYTVNSNKCISYQTIENKDEIDISHKGKFENWIFGCDICQDVCPWNNKFSLQTLTAEFIPESMNKELSLEEVNLMSSDEFNKRFKESPVKRTKLKGLKRNINFVLDAGV